MKQCKVMAEGNGTSFHNNVLEVKVLVFMSRMSVYITSRKHITPVIAPWGSGNVQEV